MSVGRLLHGRAKPAPVHPSKAGRPQPACSAGLACPLPARPETLCEWLCSVLLCGKSHPPAVFRGHLPSQPAQYSPNLRNPFNLRIMLFRLFFRVFGVFRGPRLFSTWPPPAGVGFHYCRSGANRPALHSWTHTTPRAGRFALFGRQESLETVAIAGKRNVCLLQVR